MTAGDWYPTDWAPGKEGASNYRPRGEPVELRGGPLAGRCAHVFNGLEALWVAELRARLIVTSSDRQPTAPDGGLVAGRYVLDPRSGHGVMLWHPNDEGRRPVLAPTPPRGFRALRGAGSRVAAAIRRVFR